jgi:hypothetical protein
MRVPEPPIRYDRENETYYRVAVEQLLSRIEARLIDIEARLRELEAK